MSVVDRILLEISRVIEAIFEEMEYRIAKRTAAKQKSSKYWFEEKVRIDQLKRADQEELN